MSGIAGDHSMSHHPFIVFLEGILFLMDRGQGGAQYGIFEHPIGRPGQPQPGGFGRSFFVRAAGGSLQADAAVFPQLVFSLEPPGCV